MAQIDTAAPTNPYLPGHYYESYRGITLDTFEDIESGYAKAVVIEDGFINDPGSIQRAILVANLSSINTSVVLDYQKLLNKNLPYSRENERELNGFLLPRGATSHFCVPPYLFNVTCTRYVITERGGRKQLTSEGFSLFSLQNQVVTYNDDQVQGQVNENVNRANLNHYCLINNDSAHELEVTISKVSTAYAPPPNLIRAQKLSRDTDLGGEVVKKYNILPHSSWHFKPPVTVFTMRAIEPPSVADVFGINTLMVPNESLVPDQSDYILLSETNCRAGQVVVIADDKAKDGGIVMKAYKAREIKFVKGTIVRTERVRGGAG